MDVPVIIIGAGPAGLAAGIECGRRGMTARILEKNAEPGGLCRTVEYEGYRFDIGGHRFFTRNAEVDALWRDILGDEFLRRPRKSRIHFKGRFVDYPLRALDALRAIGPVETAVSMASYAKYAAAPKRPERSFEDWAENNFGRRLYEHFFRDYTEKVWGIPCAEIASEWGAQRIRGLNLLGAVRAAVFGSKGGRVKTLIDEFDYPRFGPGQMFSAMADRCRETGVEIDVGVEATGVETTDGSVSAVRVRSADGVEERLPCRAVLSSMPLTDLARGLDTADDVCRAAADALTYRGIVVTALLLDTPPEASDTWIYVHDPALAVGRIQFFHNWSPAMVPDGAGSVGCEIFASEGDEHWTASDGDLVEICTRELHELGLVDPDRVRGGTVVRAPKAYPVSRIGYREHVDAIRRVIDPVDGLQPIGRYGMFQYNNMDHSILTGLRAVRTLDGAAHDVWNVNADEEYLEGERIDEDE